MEPFFTTKPVGKGTGLGLSRVYGTVRAHGGAVEIQQRSRAEGTTVTLRLPTTSRGLGRRLGPRPSEGSAVRTLRILLVDDEGIILETIPAMLESMGHTVETACLGEEALRRLDLHRVSTLVILDHNMPGLSGVETLVQLRGKYPGLPVILSTGFLDTKAEDLLAGIPRVWVLKKPYNKRELQKILAESSRRSPMAGERASTPPSVG